MRIFFYSFFSVLTFALVFSSSNCPRWVFLGLRRICLFQYHQFFLFCFVFWEVGGNPKPTSSHLPPSPPSHIHFPFPSPLQHGSVGGGGLFSPMRPSSLCLHCYTSLLLCARMRVHSRRPGWAGLCGGLPLSPESLWRLRHIRYIWWDPPAANLVGWRWGGHGGGHGASATAAVEALGGLQPGEHSQRVREVGGRRWCVGWGAHLRMKREKTQQQLMQESKTGVHTSSQSCCGLLINDISGRNQLDGGWGSKRILFIRGNTSEKKKITITLHCNTITCETSCYLWNWHYH